ncbi:MAG: peptidoglycan-binding domain-containing protein [Candidatus Binatia bacterium]
MRLRQSILPAFIIVGSLGLGATSPAANEIPFWVSDKSVERYPTTIEDDQSLPPGVPGITENNISDMSRREVMNVQEILENHGYAPGNNDGVMDNDTRAAIRDFQRDNDLVITGTVDRATAEVLDMRSDRSG